MKNVSPIVNNQTSWDGEHNTGHSFNCHVPEMHIANHIDKTSNDYCKDSQWCHKVSNEDGGCYEYTKGWKAQITVQLFGNYFICFPT